MQNKKINNVIILDGQTVNKKSTSFILKNNFATLCSLGGNYERQKQDSKSKNQKIF